MKIVKKNSPACSAILFLPTLLAFPGLAAGQAIEEVVITAQKRDQSIQDVPIAVSAINAEALLQKGIGNIGDIGSFAPNVKVTSTPSNTTGATIAIRGSVTVNPAITWEPTVGIYLDGIFIGKNLGGIFDIAALERVEVLRGPQGTLYGKNTIGGAVNLITQKPSGQPSGQPGGRLKVGYGNYNQREIAASVDTPSLQLGAAGEIMAKLTGSVKKRDGFYDIVSGGPEASFAGNPIRPNPPLSNEFDSLDSRIFRADVLWDATDRLTLRYTFDRIDVDNHPSKAVLTHVDNSAGAFAGLLPEGLAPYIVDVDKNRKNAFGDGSDYERSLSDSHSIFADYALGEAGFMGDITLKYIANSRELKWDDVIDDDGTPFTIFHTIRFVDYKQESHELQTVGSTDHIDYVIGLYYFSERGDVLNAFPALAYLGAPTSTFRYGLDNSSLAAYGQMDWRPAAAALQDRLTLTFGLRWTKEEKEGYADHVDGFAAKEDSTFVNLSPTVVASWRFTDDISIYGKYSEGWKAGGFNGEASSELSFRQGYDAATVDAYELGLKSRWLDNTLQLNGAVFYNKLGDMQLTIFTGDTDAASEVGNAGAAVIAGLEFELLYQPTPELQVSASYGYLHAKYEEYLEVDRTTGLMRDFRDERDFPYASRHTLNLGLDYTFYEGSLGQLRGHLDYSFVDDYVPYVEPEQNLTSQIDGYGLFNGRLTLQDIPVGDGQSLDLSIWGKNLTNEEYRVNTIPFVTFTTSFYGNPRTYGIDLTYKF